MSLQSSLQSKLEAVPSRLEAITLRWETIATRWEAIASVFIALSRPSETISTRGALLALTATTFLCRAPLARPTDHRSQIGRVGAMGSPWEP